MTVQTPFPHSPEELTELWLTDSLRASGALDPDGAVSAFSTELLGEGAGLMGAVLRIALSYDGTAGPSSIIGKFSTTVLENQAVAATFDLYAREVHFYQHLAPEVKGRCPRCYRAELQEDGRACVLLLEDFPHHQVGDQALGATLEQSHACMIEAARLHATHWGGTRPDAAPPYAEKQAAVMRQMAAALWEPMVERHGEVLPADVAGLREEYLEKMTPLQEWFSGPQPNTVVHGDFRLDNLLFGAPGAPDPVVMVDFQAPQWSKGVQDLSYLLTQSLDVELRRAHEHELLDAYRAELAKLGVSYAADDCWEDYRRASLLNFAVAIAITGLKPPNERAERFQRATIQRAAAAFEDLGLLEVLRTGAP